MANSKTKNKKIDFETALNSIAKQIQLNFKYIGASKTLPIFLFLFVMFPVLGAMIFIPLRMVGPLIFQYACFIPAAILYGSITYNIRYSTLIDNLSITKNSKNTFYIASLITLILIALVMFYVSLTIIIIFSQFNLLMIDWLGTTQSQTNYYNWNNFNMLIATYSVIVGVVLTFSIMFCFQTIFKSKNSYYIFVFLLMILCIIFGGLLNDYFIKTKKYNNRVFPVIGGSYLFPRSMFFGTSILFPFFNIGETSSVVFKQITNFDKVNGVPIIGAFRDFNQVHFNSILFINGPKANWEWNMVSIMPFIHIAFFVLLGKFLGIKKSSI